MRGSNMLPISVKTCEPELKMIADKYQDKDNLIINNSLSDVK